MSDISADTIKAAGFEFDQLDPNIFLVKNFLTQEENDYYCQLAESLTEEDWNYHYLKGIKDRVKQRYGTEDYEEAGVEVTHDWVDKVVSLEQYGCIQKHKLDQRLQSLFDKNCGLSFRSFGIIQRQYEGAELRGHFDQYVDDRMKWASVVYINDNYNGGEFYFRDKNIELIPPPRSILIFPATKEYWHGVKVVHAGPVRYAIPAFTWSEPDVM